MSKTQTIELDEATVAALKARADERGMTVPDLVAEYLHEDRMPAVADDDQIAELDRRWAAIQGGETTIKHEKVVRWLETWGTPAFSPWRDQ
jgi:predicted transcriptional regulator